MTKAKRELAIDLLVGALAGAAATWLMDGVTTALYEREPWRVKRRENKARGDRTAYEIAAEKGAKLAGRRLTKPERQTLGNVIHWTLGVSSGALYGVLRNQVRGVGLGSGLAYGTAFWIVMDEAALTALGLTPPPQEFPWQTHARGLAGHLVLGAVIEGVFDTLDLFD